MLCVPEENRKKEQNTKNFRLTRSEKQSDNIIKSSGASTKK